MMTMNFVKIVDSWVNIEDVADVHESMIEAELARIDNEGVGSNVEEEADMKEEQEDVLGHSSMYFLTWKLWMQLMAFKLI